MNLPPMCPAYGHQHHYISPPSLRTCWIKGCFASVAPSGDALGLCDEHHEELREG